MVRSLSLLSAALSVGAACAADDRDVAPDAAPACDLATCPDVEHWFNFASGVRELGAGTGISLDYASDLLADDVRIVSDDPAVLEVGEATDVIELAGLAPGRATLRAETSDGSLLDETTFEVLAIAAVEFHLRVEAIEPGPVDHAVGLLGSSDSVRVVYRGTDGEPVPGRGTFSGGGSIEIPEQDVDARLSEVFSPGVRVGVAFVAAGAGELSADLSDGRSFSLPFDVVRVVQSIEVITLVLEGGQVVTSDQASVDELVGADVIARRRDGSLVLGVTADWSVQPAAEFVVGPGPSTEAVFYFPHAEAATVTAAHDGLSAARRMTIP
jgi:hypothetical protein